MWQIINIISPSQFYTVSNCPKFTFCTLQCACQFPNRRLFDSSLGKCLSLVGTYCGEELPICVENAECFGGRCKCREGNSQTKNNTCFANFGEECVPNQCNSDRGLACKENKESKESKCQCLDASFVYSVVHKNCIDPEAVVRNLLRQIAQMVARMFVSFKISQIANIVTAPIRLVIRFILRTIGLG